VFALTHYFAFAFSFFPVFPEARSAASLTDRAAAGPGCTAADAEVDATVDAADSADAAASTLARAGNVHAPRP
jgi:hypothetical protein